MAYIKMRDVMKICEGYSEHCFNSNDARGQAIADRILDDVVELPTANVVEVPINGIGELSDGYHSFNELYHHRAVLFSVICNLMPNKAWKSKLHSTGDMYEGMFIVGIETPEGQATYHYNIEPYWNMFKVKELEKAPEWDGHTSSDAINRIARLIEKEENKNENLAEKALMGGAL